MIFETQFSQLPALCRSYRFSRAILPYVYTLRPHTPHKHYKVISMGGSSSPSAASALKSAYSGYDKAVTSLAITTHALANLHNVEVPIALTMSHALPMFMWHIELF
jgi:hypothetical protein